VALRQIAVVLRRKWTMYVLQDIGAAWKTLENAEKGFEEWLLSEMQRCVGVFCRLC